MSTTAFKVELNAIPQSRLMAHRCALQGLDPTSASGVKRKYGFVMPTASDGAANWQLEYTTAPRHRPVLDLTLDCTPALSSPNEGPIPDPPGC